MGGSCSSWSPAWKYKLFLAVLLFSGHAFVLAQVWRRPRSHRALISPPDPRVTRQFAVFVITSNQSNAERVVPLMEMWGYRMRNYSRVAAFKFMSIEAPGLEQFPSLEVPRRYKDLYENLTHKPSQYYQFDLTIKDAYALSYCVRNTTAGWCFRLMDDTYVNDEGFDAFVAHLDALPDPFEKEIVLGNCMTCRPTGWYLQGGSGMVFSRRAAERFLDFQDEWITALNVFEDFHVIRIAEQLGLTSHDADCPYFSGHFLRRKWWQRFSWNNSDNFPLCPESLANESYCNHRLFPYHKVAFVHALKNFMTQQLWRNWFDRMPRDAMMYYIGTTLHICRARMNEYV